MIEQNHDITLGDLGDECRRMSTVLDDAAVVKQNAGECGYVGRIAPLSKNKKKRQENISDKKLPSPCWLCGGRTIVETFLTDITFVMSVERKEIRKRNERLIERFI
ncbi:unnamed protein product [Hymenolepis diminuta]|uniref:Uncharacterized protein n=1 Tax=Hymenolepis diminuta TaxID=6216 RepID=A0A564Y8V2_HYMDI|nr:unnamed protein product [Hymenolepis diminuta]